MGVSNLISIACLGFLPSNWGISVVSRCFSHYFYQFFPVSVSPSTGVDQQPIVNFNEWRLLYFIAFILLVGFFVLNMFVGVVVENFHRCREEQEKEEKIRRAAKRAIQMEKKRKRKPHEALSITNGSAHNTSL